MLLAREPVVPLRHHDVERCANHLAGMLLDPGQMHATLRGLGFSPAEVARLWEPIQHRVAELTADLHGAGGA